jgi:hypothetical protein
MAWRIWAARGDRVTCGAGRRRRERPLIALPLKGVAAAAGCPLNPQAPQKAVLLRKGVNSMINVKRLRLLLPVASAAASIAMILAWAPAALAATCPPPPSDVNPFLSWGDSNTYVPVTDGNFEPIPKGSLLSPWTFSNSGASIVSDNEPWHVDSVFSDDHALFLQTGSKATSACTTAPNIASIVRFFVKNTGSSTGTLHVQLLVNGGKNGILDGGYISAGSSWHPSQILYLPWANRLSGAVNLQVVLTAVGTSASFEVDDLYIDPRVAKLG